MHKNIKSEDAPEYKTRRLEMMDTATKSDEDRLINLALSILRVRLQGAEYVMSEPDTVKNYLQLKIAELEHEVFGCLWLDNRHRLIADEQLFRGTVDGASVYPREVAKSALAHNAVAVILYHNHPSGVSEPSRADQAITDKLKQALALLDIRVLDHFIVGQEVYGFASHGLL